MKSRRFTDGHWSHRLFLRFRLVATGPDNFGNRAVRRSEFQRDPASFGNDGTAAGLDFRDTAVAILDSKGIPERMEAYERFLINNPDQRGRVTYLQIAPTSRSEVPEYGALSRAVNETLGRIN